MAKIGNIIKWSLALIVGLCVIGMFIFLREPTEDEVDMTLPACSDGEDNDNDGLIDYPKDPDCSDGDDNFEQNLSWLTWLVWIILLLAFLGGIIYVIWVTRTKNNKNDQGLYAKPVDVDRAWDIARTWFIDNYAWDIMCNVSEEKDIIIKRPINKEDIQILEQEPDESQKTGESFQFWFFQVNYGRMLGIHMMATSLSRGEEYIIGGIRKFKEHVVPSPDVVFKKRTNTWHMTSLQDKKERMLASMLDNTDLDTDLIRKEMQDILGSSERASLADLDDDERKDYLQTQMEKTVGSKKKKQQRKNIGQSLDQQISDIE